MRSPSLHFQILAVEAASARDPRNDALRAAVETLRELGRLVGAGGEVEATVCDEEGESDVLVPLKSIIPDGLSRAMEGLMP